MNQPVKNPLRTAVHADAEKSIQLFARNIKQISGIEEVADAYGQISPAIRNGRTLREMALDDAMDAFACLMIDIPPEDVPTDYYGKMLRLRHHPLKIPPAKVETDMRDHIERVKTDFQSSRKVTVVPGFISYLADKIDPDIQEDLAFVWMQNLHNMCILAMNESALAVQERAQILAEGFNSLVNQKMAGRRAAEPAGPSRPPPGKPATGAAKKPPAGNKPEDKLAELTQKIQNAGLPPEAHEAATRALDSMGQMNPASSDYQILQTYVEWMAAIPWKKSPPPDINIVKAEEILDEDHYGLAKVKEAITEHLAVQKLTGTSKGKIICLVGPPGIGKTSLGKSVARATGRKFVRMSLGGVRDEAKIRGHIKTYVGAMPGVILQTMRKAGTTNPLMLLDEMDKLSADYKGDPSDALLEVLDPEQNSTFRDHYLEVDYDLSDVMFLCTANYLEKIPAPLRDRMEIIRLPGYSREEKFEIARRFLVDKQRKAAGLKDTQFAIDDGALTMLIEEYTREAGVRGIEREIETLCRKAAKSIVKGLDQSMSVTVDNLASYLGRPRIRKDKMPRKDTIGHVTGLAWTSVGGCTLPIQAVAVPSNHFRIVATGRLGEVMRESITAAEGLVRALAPEFNLSFADLNKMEIRLHAPDGAVPKDGPSAGVAMVTNIISVLTDTPVRKDVAMTGEITLHGEVTAIGGLPEKLAAALAAGAKTVLIPSENEGDLDDLPEKIKKSGLEIITVDNVKDVIKHALIRDVFNQAAANDDALPAENPEAEVAPLPLAASDAGEPDSTPPEPAPVPAVA